MLPARQQIGQSGLKEKDPGGMRSLLRCEVGRPCRTPWTAADRSSAILIQTSLLAYAALVLRPIGNSRTRFDTSRLAQGGSMKMNIASAFVLASISVVPAASAQAQDQYQRQLQRYQLHQEQFRYHQHTQMEQH